jgi:prepilin-type N-terminal cleavage/methylation domain-containing protein
MLIRPRSKKAFTLLELIVVIVILGLLAALAIPTFARVTKKSQDASTSATISSVLRDARALMAFQEAGSSWESSVVTALGETAVPSASGLLAAGYSQFATSGEPTREKPVYSVSSGVVALSMLSDSGNVCVGTASTAASAAPVCGPGFPIGSTSFTAGQAAQGKALFDGSFAPLPSGATGGSSTPNPNTPSPVAALAAPTNVVATAGDAEASVSWDAVNGATSYDVSVNGAAPVSVTGTTHKATGLVNGAPLTFSVVAKADGRMSSSATSSNSVTPAAATYYSNGSFTSSGSAPTVLAGRAGTTGTTNATTGDASRFSFPRGMVAVGDQLYVVDDSGRQIRKVNATTGATSLLAGASTWGSADSTGAAARFNGATGITTDGTNLYVADTSNNSVRKVVIATGAVSTVPLGSETLNLPRSVTYLSGKLYVSDTNNGRVVVVDLVGRKAEALVALGGAAGITTDGTNLYVTSAFGSVNKVDPNAKTVVRIAGSPSSSGYSNGRGVDARFNSPAHLVYSAGQLYVSDSGNNVIRKVSVDDGTTSTYAGTGASGSSDGYNAVSATFAGPQGITVSGSSLFIAETSNHVVRKLS